MQAKLHILKQYHQFFEYYWKLSLRFLVSRIIETLLRLSKFLKTKVSQSTRTHKWISFLAPHHLQTKTFSTLPDKRRWKQHVQPTKFVVLIQTNFELSYKNTQLFGEKYMNFVRYMIYLIFLNHKLCFQTPPLD